LFHAGRAMSQRAQQQAAKRPPRRPSPSTHHGPQPLAFALTFSLLPCLDKGNYSKYRQTQIIYQSFFLSMTLSCVSMDADEI
jgi:hypothetical protein